MIGDTPPPLPALPLMCRNPIFIDEYMTLSMVHGSFYGGPFLPLFSFLVCFPRIYAITQSRLPFSLYINEY